MAYYSVLAAFLLLLSGIGATLLTLERVFGPQHRHNEPPNLPPRLPFIGHLLGLFRHGTQYFSTTSSRIRSPIYTLNILSKKLYVVTGPELVNAVSRNSKTLNFNPFISEVGVRLTGVDGACRAIIDDNLDGKRGAWGYVIDVHDRTVVALGSGPGLESISQTMLEQSAVYLQNARSELRKGPVHLYAWVRRFVTLCSTNAIYGKDNPLRLFPDLKDAFLDFDNDLNILLIDIAPALLARKGHRARNRLANAFTQYFARSPLGRSSALIEGRYETGIKYGMSARYMGQLEVGTLLGILVNSIPTLFYMLHYIYADEALLRDVRAEVEKCVADDECKSKSERGMKKLRFARAKVRDECPVLLSVLQEVLRFYSRGASARLVLEDTMLNEQYLLEKGAVVLMATAVLHTEPSVWGSSAFNARRFLQKQAGAKRNTAASYRPFGGGSTICPGRHFATAEILALTALLVYQFEVSPAAGEWRVPEMVQPNLAVNVFPPKTDVLVCMGLRAGLEDAEWVFE